MTKKDNKPEVNEDGAAAATLATKGLPPNGGAAEVEDGSGNAKNATAQSPGGVAAGTIKAKGNPMDIHPQSMKEELAVVFEGSGISEEVVEKTKTLFEAAVNARVAAEVAKVETDLNEQLVELTEAFKSELTENLDKYLDYLANQWMEQNQIAVENSLRVEMADEFHSKLAEAFASYNWDIPAEKMDALAEAVNSAEKYKAQLNEQIEKNIELTASINKGKAEKAFAEISEGLATIDIEKFKTLAGDLLEGTSDEQDLRKKLSVIRESHFKGTAKAEDNGTAKQLKEEVVSIEVDGSGATTKKDLDPRTASFVDAINRSLRR